MVWGIAPSDEIDQQDNAVDHAENTLHFAAEVGVAGGVDDIDPGVVPLDAGALGKNGDAAFFFEVIRIHRALFNALVVAEGAGLAEKLVNKGGFAVIDVRDDGDVTQRHVH